MTASSLDPDRVSDAASRLRRREYLGSGFVVLLALGVWLWLAIFHDLLTQGPGGTDLLTALGSLDWSAGIDATTARDLVTGMVAFVAVVSIAAATTRPPGRTAPVPDQVGWRRWLERLGALSVFASLLGLVTVLTQIPHGSAGATLMLGLFAALGHLLSSALTLHSDSVSRALTESALERHQKVVDRTVQQFPDHRKPTLGSLGAAGLRATALTVLPPVVYASVHSNLTGADVLRESLSWLAILAVASLLPFMSVGAYWSAWALGSKVFMAVAATLFAVILVSTFGGLVAIAVGSADWWLAPAALLWATFTGYQWRLGARSVFAQISLRSEHRRSSRETKRLRTEQQHAGIDTRSTS